MTWIISKLSGVFGPYIIGALALVIVGMGGTIGKQAWDNHSLHTDLAESKLAYETNLREQTQLAAAAQARARQLESDAAASVAAAIAKYQQELTDGQAATQRTLDSLRAGNLKLRNSLAAHACSSPLPGGAAVAGEPTGGSTGGLQAADVEFLIRFAASADAAVNLLHECVAVAKACPAR